MTPFSCILIGDESLTIACGDLLLGAGHGVRAVVTRSADVGSWAAARDLKVLPAPRDLIGGESVDWVFSIANLQLLPQAVLALGRLGAVNFHDGPLPAYAGLNAPVWAMLAGETRHGVTWHLIEGGVDAGDIVMRAEVTIDADDTALSLNGKCYAAGLESFEALLADLGAGRVTRQRQDLRQRSYFGRDRRPAAGGLIDPTGPADPILRLVRAMDFGIYPNPLARPKLMLGEVPVAIGHASFADGTGVPGAVLAVEARAITLACADGLLRLSGLTLTDGSAVDATTLVWPGTVLPPLRPDQVAALNAAHESAAPREDHWRRMLAAFDPCDLFLVKNGAAKPHWKHVPLEIAPGQDLASLAVAATLWARQAAGPGAGAGLALGVDRDPEAAGFLSDWVPLAPKFCATLADLRTQIAQAAVAPAAARGFALDLALRDPGLPPLRMPHLGLSPDDTPVAGTAACLLLASGRLAFDATRIDPAYAALLAARFNAIATAVATAKPDTEPEALLALPDDERRRLSEDWNATACAYDTALTLPAAFAAQAAATPQATAIICEDARISYADLAARVDAIAHHLARMGVSPGNRVGIYCARSIDMVAGCLGIQKAGAGYVPLDPAYPADRIAHYIADSGARVIVTQDAIAHRLPDHGAEFLLLDVLTPARAAFEDRSSPDGVAYLIYTSGSTGTPKGVMVTHRNVVNFFAGMDPVIDRGLGRTWAALTSLSFDISVLELFYTLARGFTVVLMGDGNRAAVSNGPIRLPGRRMDFSLFYWGNDDGAGRGKYELLLEGAKFADANGFNAVWTPERHFHAFGGPYPNPSVTGAAVAAVTRNLSVRAGSCVAPLHHTARIAEEWSVIDNLTNGRAGLAIASGWQPDDFVLRPENTPPANKPAMYDAIDKLRRLWRGEAVEFPTAKGDMFPVVTQPRPVSAELPVWVTTAGNPDTWREAGEIGANVLTHLLGQSIDEVAEKITIYHDALRASGRDPADHTVTMMLHTFIAEDRATARAVARGPMKDYLRSAAALIKQYAWAFPAFKRPKGVANPFEMDLGSLTPEEMDAILDFAFERYFEDSGLFGTVADGIARADQLRAIGVTEIACLIDYGIPKHQVLDGLRPLARVLQGANEVGTLAPDDVSLAAQIVRHQVSHLQCTPSMAQIIALNDEARLALSGVRQLMLGGEALPATLVDDLRRATRARIDNMYGPTETTIWSTTQRLQGDMGATAPIGRPIANTDCHVVAADGTLAPVGVPGELLIGGDGVTLGYWNRPEMTAERFLPNPYGGDSRVYRTGDLVCRRADGTLDFLGRGDAQVKIRGQRIEPGEIEAAMAAFPGVTQAVVIDRPGAGGAQLAGYLTGGGVIDRDALRAHLAARLPEVMVPTHLVQIEAFPLTPNRKIDRKALPATDQVAARPAPVVPAPVGSGAEEVIAGIWRRILGVDRIAPGDSFFALGGHSLLAVQAHRNIRAALNRPDLSITDIFRFPTLGALAAHLAGSPQTPLPEPPAETGKSDVMARRREMRASRAAKAG